MTGKRKIVLGVAIFIAALLLFSVTILPHIIRSKAVAEIAKATGRKVSLASVSINPFSLTVTLKGFSVKETNGAPFIDIGTVRTSLAAASLFKRALIMDEVTIDAPSFIVARTAPNRYNFSDIAERQNAGPKKEPSGEFRFSINNIKISNGSMDFNDRSVDGGRKHTIRKLDVAIPFISNIPYLIEKYTDPHVSALVNGAPFSFNGKIKPLSKSMETMVRIDLKRLDLPELAAYSPVPPPADLTSGALTVDSEVTYRISKDKKPELSIKGLIGLDNIAINLKNGQPLLKLPLFQIKASNLEVFSKRFLFNSITIDGMELFAGRNAKGEWMFSKLLAPQARGEKKSVADEKSLKPLVQIAAFIFKNGMVHFSDALPKGGFKGEATQIDLAIKNFTTAANASADYELSLLLDNEATLSADGMFSLTPLTATVSSELSGLKIQRGWPYLSQFLASPVKAAIDIASEASYSRENGLVVKQGSLLATGLSARYGDKEGFDLARFEVNGIGYDQKKNSVEAAEIRLSQGNLSLSREQNGAISILSLLKQGNKKSTQVAGSQSKVQNSRRKSPPLSYSLEKLRIDKFNAVFTDKTVEEKPRFTLKNTSLALTGLNGPKFKSSPLRFSSTFNKATSLKASGNITPYPFRYKGSVNVNRLLLRDFEAYFPSSVNVFILGGFADTGMNVDIALKDGKPTGSFKGSAGIRSFHAIDTVSEEDLLKWESLQLDNIQGNLEPFSLALKQIALNGVYSRIVIGKDGTLNLQNLVQKEEKQPGAPSATVAAASATTSPAETATTAKPAQPPVVPVAQQPVAARKKISIEAVTIQDGTLSFTDNHLPQHFATTFYNLGGRVSGLSSEDTKFADVDLRGNLENHSPLQITGQINPLRDDLFVDLKVSFRDIELSPVTPYSGNYLGYKVEKGKLFLDLKYHIEKKLLNSENKIFIDQFTFGEKVQSDKATSLPVKLGLALLKDRKGEIHLDVPVTGRTDDPKFNIWKLVFQVLKNLMMKAVTSPFSLLSSMFGGGEDFSSIQFSPGASALSSQEELKLNALSKALLDRPALKIELKGYVDSEKDTEGYRTELLDHKLRNEKFLALSKAGTLKEGEKAETIQVLPEENNKYLAAVYKKEKFPKPRNVIGLVKELPAAEMKKLIIANTVVKEPELKILARERVVAVMNYLVKKGNVPAERIFQKDDNVFKAPEKEKGSRSRVELNAIVQ